MTLTQSAYNAAYYQAHRSEMLQRNLARREGQRQHIKAIARSLGCSECGARDNLTFHHVDPNDKRREVSEMTSYAWATIEAEIAKCVVLCFPCHRAHHYG